MRNITLDFYDERKEIELPNNFEILKEKICRLYYFDPIDLDKLLLIYFKRNKKCFITNERDYVLFLAEENLREVFLDIPNVDRLYQSQIVKLQEEEKLKEELEKRISNSKKCLKYAQAEYDEFKHQEQKMEEFTKKIYQYKKRIERNLKNYEKKYLDNYKRIREIEEMLGIETKANLKPFFKINSATPTKNDSNANPHSSEPATSTSKKKIKMKSEIEKKIMEEFQVFMENVIGKYFKTPTQPEQSQNEEAKDHMTKVSDPSNPSFSKSKSNEVSRELEIEENFSDNESEVLNMISEYQSSKEFNSFFD